jgi:NAD(P)-dependent dehydrogenase (short-subunit alcohol dehydrogenase family)
LVKGYRIGAAGAARVYTGGMSAPHEPEAHVSAASAPRQGTPRVALVTGGSRGIGRVIALQLAARGVRIALHYRSNQAAAEATLHSLPGGGHALFAADLTDTSATTQLWAQVIARFNVDILINNAGLFIDHPPLRTAYADWQAAWQRTLAANLIAPANLSLLAAQAMAARPLPGDDAFGRGRIVNISSRGAFRGEPESPAYGASKAGLNALSQSLAKALAPNAIYVYAVAPGWVETEMASGHLAGPEGGAILAQHPLGRVNRTDEVAQAAVFCALDAPPAMTAGVIDVNGASYLRS